MQLQIFKFQTYFISSIIDQKPSYIPPLEIPKVWWCYIIGLCGYQPPHRGTFGLRGIEMAGWVESNLAPTCQRNGGIGTDRQTPSTVLFKTCHNDEYNGFAPYTAAIYIITLKDLRYPILYSMNGHVGLFSAASTSSYYFYTQKHTFWATRLPLK
jgi:hypothetical protein